MKKKMEEKIQIEEADIKKLFKKFLEDNTVPYYSNKKKRALMDDSLLRQDMSLIDKRTTQRDYQMFKAGFVYSVLSPLFPDPKFRIIGPAIDRMTKLKTKQICLDIDYSTKRFIKTYLQVMREFPSSSNGSVVTELSSSRMGYHIIINLKKPITVLENLLYRCVFNDCAMRLKLSVNRMISGVPGRHHYDLIFNKKNGKEVIPINMKQLLKPYDKKVKWILNNWGDVKVEDEIQTIAEGVEKKLPTKTLWTAGFNFKGDTAREIVARISDSARTHSSMKGENPGFRFILKKNVQPEWDYVFAVFGRDKQHSTSRAAYVWNNTLKEIMGKEAFAEFRENLKLKEREKVNEALKKVGVSLYWEGKEWTK